MANDQSQNFFQESLKKGLILGVIHIIIFLALYAFAPGKLTGFSIITLTIVINFSYIIYSNIQLRRELGGYMKFGTAFKHAFLIFLISGILNLVFSVLFILIDPTLPETMAQAQVDTSIYWAKTFGAPEETLEKMEGDMDLEKLTEQYNLFGHLKAFGFLLIFYALGASIIALITRKNEPEII